MYRTSPSVAFYPLTKLHHWPVAVLVMASFPAFARLDDSAALWSNPRPVLKAALRDPFLAPLTVMPKVSAPVAPLPAPPIALPLERSEPLPQIIFTGSIIAADGRLLVMAQWGDGQAVTLEQGKILRNGYRVERMSSSMVELLNPQTQAVVQIPIPAAPRFEIR
jgi:hypothetical protein